MAAAAAAPEKRPVLRRGGLLYLEVKKNNGLHIITSSILKLGNGLPPSSSGTTMLCPNIII